MMCKYFLQSCGIFLSLSLIFFSLFPSFLFFFFKFYLFERLRKREGHTKNAHVLIPSLNACNSWSWMKPRPGTLNSIEIFHNGRQGYNPSHHLSPPGVCLSRKFRLKSELGLESRDSNLGCGCPKPHSSNGTKFPSHLSSFLMVLLEAQKQLTLMK